MLGTEFTPHDAELLYKISKLPGIAIWIDNGCADTPATISHEPGENGIVTLESDTWQETPLSWFEYPIRVYREIDFRTSEYLVQNMDRDAENAKILDKVIQIGTSALNPDLVVDQEKAIAKMIALLRKL